VWSFTKEVMEQMHRRASGHETLAGMVAHTRRVQELFFLRTQTEVMGNQLGEPGDSAAMFSQGGIPG